MNENEKRNDGVAKAAGGYGEVLAYHRGALTCYEVEAASLLNTDLDNVYEGFFTVQIEVPGKGEPGLMEVRFQKMVKQDGNRYRVGVPATVLEAVSACGVLGDMVRIPVKLGIRNEELEIAGDSVDGAFDRRLMKLVGELDVEAQVRLMELLENGEKLAVIGADNVLRRECGCCGKVMTTLLSKNCCACVLDRSERRVF